MSVWNPRISKHGNVIQTIGFYGPDPGGHQPFHILKNNGNVVSVRQLIDGMELDIDKRDLMDLTGLKSHILEVMNGERYSEHGPMAGMREPLLWGYISTILTATGAAFSVMEVPSL
jgi:hypothetical protein